jgi:DNA-binding CsgD family transcriptional regulator
MPTAMQPLAIADVEQIVNLVARAGDPTLEMSLPERKRMLLEGVAELVDADTWMWSNVTLSPTTHGDMMTTWLIDGGYRNERERAAFYAMLSNASASEAIGSKAFDAARQGRYVTLVRKEMLSDSQWMRLKELYPTHIEDMVISTYPLGEHAMSGVGLHRRAGRPDFSERDRAIAHVVFQQVDWLHRHGANVPAGEAALQLTPRERQVLVYLLGGDSLKEVARKLTISENTVASYVKGIYKCFSVNSRPELLAHFITGGQGVN